MNKTFELTGVLIKKYDEEQLTTTFKKREFIIDVPNGSNYSQKIVFTLLQSNCNKLDEFEENDILTINFNVKGREWVDADGEVKFFNSLEAYRIFKEDDDSTMIHSDTTGEGKDLDF